MDTFKKHSAPTSAVQPEVIKSKCAKCNRPGTTTVEGSVKIFEKDVKVKFRFCDKHAQPFQLGDLRIEVTNSEEK